MALIAIAVFLPLFIVYILFELETTWRYVEKIRRGAPHGDAGQSGDVEAILHGDLGAILRRQMPGAADTDPPS